jgi:hypothetical protein
MSRVSRGSLSAQVVQRRFQRRHNEGEVLERLGGTISPLTAKQAWILGESSGRSGEAPVRFKMVSEEWCAAVDVARPPTHAFEFRSGSMSQCDLDEELSRSFRIRGGISDV